MNRLSRALIPLSVALAVVVGCGPTPEDEAQMEKKMALETQQAELMLTHAKDCKTLETELVAFSTKNKDALQALDAWWGGLGDGAKDKLIEKHRAAWDKQSGGMIAAGGCPDALKAGQKAAL